VRIVAYIASIWIGWRWLGFLFGIARVRGFEKGPARREARRSVIARGAINVFLSVAVLYLWAEVAKLQPNDVFVGFLAAAMMCSLAIGVATAFMQPAERNPQTLDICRVFRPKAHEPS
jgi:hypothetical protein